MQFVGILLVISVPVFHNLHNIFFDYLANNSIPYYKNYYYFGLTILHSLAPALGFLGCVWLPKKLKWLLVVPISFEIYKSIEKIPNPKQSFSIYYEYWVLSGLFVLSFSILAYYFYKPKIKLTHKEEKEAEKHLENIKKELNLK